MYIKKAIYPFCLNTSQQWHQRGVRAPYMQIVSIQCNTKSNYYNSLYKVLEHNVSFYFFFLQCKQRGNILDILCNGCLLMKWKDVLYYYLTLGVFLSTLQVHLYHPFNRCFRSIIISLSIQYLFLKSHLTFSFCEVQINPTLIYTCKYEEKLQHIQN